MRVLITGITGMIGSHLADLLQKYGYEISGISRATSLGRLNTISKKYKHYLGDILDKNFLSKVWNDFKPDIVFHLAAQAYNSLSWEFEDTTYLLNISGTRNVFECVKQITPYAKLIPACSSAEYGFVPIDKQPIIEDLPLRPVTPYGVTKVVTENMALQYFFNYNIDVIIPRLFIHVGPNHPPATALQSFAMQLALIKKNKQSPEVYVGNIKTERDFIDVRDGCEGLFTILNKGKSGEVYNICSGISQNIEESLYKLIQISGLKVEVKIDKTKYRLSDEVLLLGNNSKLKSLGWEQKINFNQTLSDIYENWLVRLK